MKYKIVQLEEFPGYRIDTNADMWTCLGHGNQFQRQILTNKWRKMKLGDNGKGYKLVSLRKGNKLIKKYIHRLMAEIFIPNPENKKYINHKDGNKSNNKTDNLEWVTRSENEKHAYATGLKPRNEKHHKAKLNRFQVQRMRLMKEVGPKLTQKKIAKLFNITQQHVSDIIKRKIWHNI